MGFGIKRVLLTIGTVGLQIGKRTTKQVIEDFTDGANDQNVPTVGVLGAITRQLMIWIGVVESGMQPGSGVIKRGMVESLLAAGADGLRGTLRAMGYRIKDEELFVSSCSGFIDPIVGVMNSVEKIDQEQEARDELARGMQNAAAQRERESMRTLQELDVNS